MTQRTGVQRLILALAGVAVVGCSSVDPLTEEYRAISIQPLLESQKRVQTCVSKKGFDVTLRPDGSFRYTSWEIPEDQLSLVDAAIEECNRKHPPGGRNEPWPRDKLPKLYALELEAAKCVRGLGFAVADPPSEQRFIDTYGTPQAWSARGAALAENQLTEEAYVQVVTTCPDPEGFGTP